MIYAIEIWSSVPPSLLKPLVTKQKAAIRLISNKPYNYHTEPLFKSLAILPLASLIDSFKIKFIYFYVHNLTPKAFSNTWPTTAVRRHRVDQPSQEYNLRNNNDLFDPPSSLKPCRISLSTIFLLYGTIYLPT